MTVHDDTSGDAEGASAPDAEGAAAPAPAPVSNFPMWVLGLVIMIDQIDQNIVRGVVPQLKESFGISDSEVGMLLSAFVLVNGLVTVPAGYLADRWHRTRTIGHTVVGWSAITMLTATAQNFGMLLGLRALLGFGQAITEPSAASLLSDCYPTSQRGRVFSYQQVLGFTGFGLGIAIGGAVGGSLGWRWAFVLVGPPGLLVALLAYRLREVKRGHGDRLHLGLADDGGVDDEKVALFEDGFRRFVVDMLRGLRDDFTTILRIPTLRFALVGVGALLFTVTGIGAWLPEFHRRFSGLSQEEATAAVGALVLAGGIPGVLLGGRVADRYAARVQGARVVIPAWCIWIGTGLITISYIDMPFALSILLELVGFFSVTMAVPALRAGIADAVPAHLRGAGFGAFNLVSIVFGAALAPVLVGTLADVWDLRVAFFAVTPPVYLGAYVLFRARHHIEADAMKIFEAMMRAMQENEKRHGTAT